MMLKGRLATGASVVVAAAAVAGTALGSTASEASNARIVSLKVSPSKVHQGKTATVTWDLTKRATTKLQVTRCENSKCTRRTPVGDAVTRKGGAGLNTLKLRVRVRPARYALVVKAGASTKKALFRVVR